MLSVDGSRGLKLILTVSNSRFSFSKAIGAVGRRGGSVVSASDLGPEGREFEPWRVHPRCVLRQNTQLPQCLSPPRCINGNQHIALGTN